MQKKIRWDIRPDACILGAALIFLLPLRWWVAALTAAAWHEWCHYLAVTAFGCPVNVITVSAGGMRMETGALTPGQGLVCSLAGPVGELLLILLCRLFPRLAVCAFLQAAFNLLPVFPLDGGRALKNLLLLILPQKAANRVFSWTQAGTMGVLTILCLVGFIRMQMKLLPLLLLLVVFREKFLQKRRTNGTIVLP